MNVLEKILEEIKEATFQEDAPIYMGDMEVDGYVRASRIEEIIRSHMDEVNDTNVPSNWISVEERLPEAGELVKVTVHSSEWISDYNSDWVSEEDKIHYPAEYNVYDGFLCRDEAWIFYDKYNAEVTCVKEFGIDKGRVYDVVTAWMPIILPEPYKGGKENE